MLSSDHSIVELLVACKCAMGHTLHTVWYVSRPQANHESDAVVSSHFLTDITSRKATSKTA